MESKKIRPSYDHQDNRIEQLKQAVPEAFTDGEVDWNALQDILNGTPEEDSEEERFGLFWPGKKAAKSIAYKDTRGTLKKSKGGQYVDKTSNIFITGENLSILKSIKKSYVGKVDMIYLDPPYNKGEDLVYKDDYEEPLEAYLEEAGVINDNGDILESNTRTDGRFHSKWLSMMYPRLRISRELLSQSGVIMISIDDNELEHLKCIMNEIFGESNFLSTFVWKTEGNIDNQSKIKDNHEYVLCYAKDLESFDNPDVIDPNIPSDSKLYNKYIENTIVKNGPKNPISKIEVPKGFPSRFESGKIGPKIEEDFWPKIHDEVKFENGKATTSFVVESGWSCRELFEEYINNGFKAVKDTKGQDTEFYMTDTGAIYLRKERSDRQGHVLSVLEEMGSVQEASSHLSDLGISFDYPKPVKLLKYLIKVGSSDGSVVLDFFAGSGTTGEAVQQLNREEEADRKFILCQLPEEMEGEYDTIADLAVSRLQKSSEALSSGDQLRISDEGEVGDVGFKHYTLSSSNFKSWDNYDGSNIDRVETLFDEYETPLKEGWGKVDLLTEVILIQGYPLDSQIEELDEFGENRVMKVTTDRFESRLFVCLDDQIQKDTIEKIDLSTEDTFACLDSALTDEAKMRISDTATLKVI